MEPNLNAVASISKSKLAMIEPFIDSIILAQLKLQQLKLNQREVGRNEIEKEIRGSVREIEEIILSQ